MNLVFFLLALAGTPALVEYCRDYSPDESDINPSMHTAQHAWFLCGVDSVQQPNDDELEIPPGCGVALAGENLTQYRAQFVVTLKGEEDFTLNFRTTKNDYSVPERSGLQLGFSTRGADFLENGRLLSHKESVHLEPGKTQKIVIDTYGEQLLVKVGCDTVYQGRSEVANKEFVIFKTGSKTSANVSRILFNSVFPYNLKKH